MPRPVKLREHRIPMVDKLTFEIELTFPREIAASSEVLMETVPDAIFDYDHQSRLLPGVRLPRGGERLIGTSIGFQKKATEPNTTPVPADKDLPLGFHKSQEIADSVFDLSAEMDERIESLRQAQAELWTALSEAGSAATEAEYSKAERKVKKLLTKARAVLEAADAKQPG